MEDRRHRKSEELATAEADVSDLRSSASGRSRTFAGFGARRRKRVAPAVPLTPEPKVEIRLEKEKEKGQFKSSDFLTCEYQVTLEPDQEVTAIEASVIWVTEGKGEEDIGVHFFQRRKKNSLPSETFDQPQRLSTVLPSSPHSYDGKILKIRWCVRVRLFMKSGKEITCDREFRLGNDA